jgi:hypothetical protein
MENFYLGAVGGVMLRSLGRVAHHEVKGAGGGFSEACISIEGNGDADGRVLTCELKAAF